jgi:hypothetical protein
VAESISGRLRTLLGNREPGDESTSADRASLAGEPATPHATSAPHTTQAPHVPPFVTSPTLPPDAAVLHDTPSVEAQFADAPLATTLPADLPAAHSYHAELLRKMTALAEDFSLGKINRRQFEAVYTHYREQRQILDALINTLNGDAWRKAINEGLTGPLLSHNAAQLLGYALYDTTTRQPLAASPHFKIDPAQIAPFIAAQQAASEVGARISTSEIDTGRWLCFLPGKACTLAALFSVEPARAQLQLLQDLHHDFELANARRLARGHGAEAAEQFVQLWALEQAI